MFKNPLYNGGKRKQKYPQGEGLNIDKNMELTYHSFNFSVLIEADVLVWADVPISDKVGGTRAPPGGVAASTGLFNHLSWNIRSFKLRRLLTCSWWRYLNKVGTCFTQKYHKSSHFHELIHRIIFRAFPRGLK